MGKIYKALEKSRKEVNKTATQEIEARFEVEKRLKNKKKLKVKPILPRQGRVDEESVVPPAMVEPERQVEPEVQVELEDQVRAEDLILPDLQGLPDLEGFDDEIQGMDAAPHVAALQGLPELGDDDGVHNVNGEVADFQRKTPKSKTVTKKQRVTTKRSPSPRRTSVPSLFPSNTAKSDLDSSIVAYYKPHSFEAEQFRRLKTTILFPDKGKPPRTIMVTSTAPGEGKSFVSANLAVSLANSIDEYVLLLDCDLRRPSIHTKFGFPDNTPGLSEYLIQKYPLSKILLKTVIDKLTVLPCGSPPDNPSELISSDQMRQLITEVKTRYDDRYIILDSPPPYVTAEANALARQVDAIIIVVKTGKTKQDHLQDLVDTYGKEKILGIVKNFDQPLPFSKKKITYGYNS